MIGAVRPEPVVMMSRVSCLTAVTVECVASLSVEGRWCVLKQ